MKFPFFPATVVFLAVGLSGILRSQTLVTESAVTLTSNILTQGAEASVTTVSGSTTIATKRVLDTPFTNREVVSAMISRNLIGGPSVGWSLVYLVDGTGNGGVFARKMGAVPVIVPGDLLTLPLFGPTVSGGLTVTDPHGGHFTGMSETSFASISINGIPASGLATSGERTGTSPLGAQAQTLEPVSTSMAFAGGVTSPTGSRLVKGSIVIGDPKTTTLAVLPTP